MGSGGSFGTAGITGVAGSSGRTDAGGALGTTDGRDDVVTDADSAPPSTDGRDDVVTDADSAPPSVPPTRTFHDDVYPLLVRLLCSKGCHTPPNGVGFVATNGPSIGGLDFSSEAAALATLVMGETAACVNVNAAPVRLCPGAPAKSLLLTASLTGTDSAYPVFDSTNDPNYLVIEQWIAQLPKP